MPRHARRVPDLDEVQNAGKSAASLTGQLLAFSRKQVLKPQVSSGNGHREMHNMSPEFLARTSRSSPALSAEVPRIEADPVQLQQVILNLAPTRATRCPRRAARRSRPPGSTPPRRGRARAAGARPVRHDYRSRQRVRHGPATRARIFEPFFTTKGVRQRDGSGTGHRLRHRQADRRRNRLRSTREAGTHVYDSPAGNHRRPEGVARGAARLDRGPGRAAG